MEPDSTENVHILQHPIQIRAFNLYNPNISSEERLIALSTTVDTSDVVPGEPEPGIGRIPGDQMLHFWHFPCYYLQDFRSHGVQLPPCRYPQLHNTTCSHPDCPVTRSWEDDEHFGPNHGHFCELYTTDGILVICHFSEPYEGSISSGDLSFHSNPSPDPEPTRCSRCNGSGHEPEPEEPPVNDRVVPPLRRSSRIRAMQNRN